MCEAVDAIHSARNTGYARGLHVDRAWLFIGVLAMLTCRRAFVSRHDLDCRGAGACADHGAEVRAAVVLRPVGVIDPVVDRPVHGLESDFLRQTRGGDPTRLL